jgi:segregation and condensation protein A
LNIFGNEKAKLTNKFRYPVSFEIKLPLFEGPFDLMLFFIERDELDIYDIPISKITNDFLDYIHHLEKMEIEVASDFILFVATLMKIKSRMLLPRPELNEKGEEVDPREESFRIQKIQICSRRTGPHGI